MTDGGWLSLRPDSDGSPTVRLAGGALVLQSVVLVWAAIAPDTVPGAARPATFMFSLVAAAGLYRTIRDRDPDPAASWWRPDWRLWAVGMLFPVANLGVWVAYVLRTREAAASDRPTGRWKYPVLVGVLTSAVGTAIVRVAAPDTPTESFAGIVGLVALAAVGFTAVAAYYDTRYVTQVIETAGFGWLFNGYHWVVGLGVLIPTNLVFSLVYLYRRRSLLNRAARGSPSIDELAAGEATDDMPVTSKESPTEDAGDDSGPE